MITLETGDVSLAEIISKPAVRTDVDGYARWRVRIKKAGITELKASAKDFEPATLSLVGMPGNGASFAQAQLAALTERAAELERSQSTTTARADQTAANRRHDRVAGIVANPVGGVDTEGPAIQAARARAEAHQWAAVIASEPRRIPEAELQPGDVLLVLGSSPISNAIRSFEQRNLGRSAVYSHASLYLGEFSRVKMVGEMWASGFWITPLPVSVRGTRLVDVYRFPSIEGAKRRDLASRAANAFGDASRFIRAESPWFLWPAPCCRTHLKRSHYSGWRPPGSPRANPHLHDFQPRRSQSLVVAGK